MPDIIKLLPDSVANQIAAGEVIQRPASAVKELLENALDAGADQIKLIIKDAGKTLIQVTDNGQGMSPADARLSFERHATSKISQASDLFSIRTMGFRGEALASIAAIARVELRTRTAGDVMGTEIIIEGSVIESQQTCQCPVGTSIAVKNLFYNTPARRNFLKSEQIEKGHIINEFTKVALSRPDIAFMLYQNNQLSSKLEKSNLKQRVVSIFGHNYQQRMVPVEEKTDILSIRGFVLKPEFAKKKRGEQFLFVNARYIRSPYLNHAVEQAFQELIPEDLHPPFFLFLDTDPDQIDVNVHPTKTEVKFQNERFTYQIIKTAVKRALGKFNVTPTLDFERETAFDQILTDKDKPPKPPLIQIDPDYNPFETNAGSPGRALRPETVSSRTRWESLFPQNDARKEFGIQSDINAPDSGMDPDERANLSKKFIHLQHRFIMVPVKSGLMVIDHQRAHERILFERFLGFLEKGSGPSQQLLFPENIILMEHDAHGLRTIMPELKILGFDIHDQGKGTFIINATPADLDEKLSLQDLIEGIVEQYQQNLAEIKLDSRVNLARSMAKKMALKHGNQLNELEMIALTEALFACSMPYQSPSGKPVTFILKTEELVSKFK